MLKLLDIVGARPQFIKVSPILRAIDDHSTTDPQVGINEVLVHTGQHYDEEMSEVFFDHLEIKEPEYNLGVRSGTHGYQTGEMLKRIEGVLKDETPDVVIVYGDTNSTLAGALAAAKLNIPIAHVEAGLRSYNREMPEEINRVLTDHTSDILFCPTETAVDNLRKEGFTNIVNDGTLVTNRFANLPETLDNKPVVLNVGDVMYDASLQNIELAEDKSNILKKYDLENNKYALATVHRASNTDKPKNLKSIFTALREIVESLMPVVLPIHPRTKNKLKDFDIETGKVKIIPPVDYLDMIALEKSAEMIITDSGGVQKEAYFYEVPCITLRNETEWEETIQGGWNVLAGPKKEKIINTVRKKTDGLQKGTKFGYGEASQSIIKFVVKLVTVQNR